MYTELTERLQYLCNTIPDIIKYIPEQLLTDKPAPGKWSKKEILGHLIDSAANNHQRFIRAQFEQEPVIFYEQNNWVSFQHYQQEDIITIIDLWQSYNRHLAYVISHVPEEALGKQCRGRDGNLYTLSYLIEDYLVYLEHHLRQVVEY